MSLSHVEEFDDLLIHHEYTKISDNMVMQYSIYKHLIDGEEDPYIDHTDYCYSVLSKVNDKWYLVSAEENFGLAIKNISNEYIIELNPQTMNDIDTVLSYLEDTIK